MDPFAPQARTPSPSKARRLAPLALGLVLGLALLGGALSMLFTKTDPGKHKMVTQISLIAPPPPPPKPPEKPPDPPKVKEEVKLDDPKPVDEPKPAPEQPPAGPLGVDAQGTGPGDGFGLAGRPGGRDITVGGGGGGGGLGHTLFGSSTARYIAQELNRDPKLKSVVYKIEIRVWLAKDGRFQREEIVRGTGDAELDARIRAALNQLGALSTPVPQDLPQPLRIRVTSSDA
jgi:protein TonB